MKRVKRKRERDPVISLINIVFLILIFFMVAGTLSGPPDPSLEFVQTSSLECCTSPDALSISQSGALSLAGERLPSIDAYLSTLDQTSPIARLAPDRDLPAHKLILIIQNLQTHGVQNITIVTETMSS